MVAAIKIKKIIKDVELLCSRLQQVLSVPINHDVIYFLDKHNNQIIYKFLRFKETECFVRHVTLILLFSDELTPPFKTDVKHCMRVNIKNYIRKASNSNLLLNTDQMYNHLQILCETSQALFYPLIIVKHK